MWLDELQARIEGVFNPPSPPGPSRSPSPIEEDLVEDEDMEEDELEEEEVAEGDEVDISGDECAEDASHDEEEEFEYEDDNPLGLGSQLGRQDAEEYEDEDETPLRLGSQAEGQEGEDDFYDEEEADEDEDEGEEAEGEEDGSLPSHPFQQHQPYLEDEDSYADGLVDPQLEAQWAEVPEGEYDENSEDGEEEDELQGVLGQREDAETEDDIMYVGDTDEEEEEEDEEGDEDEEDAGKEDINLEDEEDLEEDELDDDGMGGPDTVPLEEEDLESDIGYEAAPVAVEDGQVVYELPTPMPGTTGVTLSSSYEPHDDIPDTQPNIDPLPLASLYPQIPTFNPYTPIFAPASQTVPPWEPTPLAQMIPDSAQTIDPTLIDPSLLADFAQRVEAQASGDISNTTEAQNTTEMTALADAVMNRYEHDESEQGPSAQLGPEPEAFQHGMGEAEGEGYEEDNESQTSSEGNAAAREQSTCTSSHTENW
jgi:hypothetical protein